MSKRKFKTEVNQLLHLLIHSLYSHKEIFLRELISNASDALDKLKYLTIADDKFKDLSYEPRIDVIIDEKNKKILTLKDNGIGMDEKDLSDSLGTIARSGTKNFLTNLSGDQSKDSNLIGQFGVGFYSVFMIADKVEVISKKAGEETAWKWTSDGKTGFSIDEAEREGQGTTVILYLNDEGKTYDNRWEVEQIIKKYSNHIAFPIFMHYEATEWEGDGDDRKEKKTPAVEQVNSASALWKRSKNDIKDDEYTEFYKAVSGDYGDPLFHVHTQAEGTMEYTTLFYVPEKAPFDMYQADYKPGVKLYVKRVFITDDEKELLPSYLRFVKGVIDSEDLPLNVSREILQQNRVMANIKTASVKKILTEIKRFAKDKEKFVKFTEEFNRPMKEGIYSDQANKETLQELVRFKSTRNEGWISFAEYKEGMKEDQKAIYYITGDNEQTIRKSPLLEAYKKKEIEVLILDDEIDEIVAPMMGPYKEIEFKAVNTSSSLDDIKTDEDKEKEEEVKPFIEKIKEVLKDYVKDVVVSNRLTDSPSCIVADANDPTMQMQQMMKAMGQTAGMPEVKPILEVNADHEILKKLQESMNDSLLSDVSFLLLDQAYLMDGVPLKDPSLFVERLNRMMSRGV